MGNWESEFEVYQGLIRCNRRMGDAVLTDDNEVKIYTDGRELFHALIAEMKKASSSIYLQYYIIREDPVWKKMEKVLRKKAGQGVEVRILYDGLGCRNVGAGRWNMLRKKGIYVAKTDGNICGGTRRSLGMMLSGRWANCRNHRKIVVIDGKIGFLGGYNIGKEYLGYDRRFGYWRDTHIRIEGSAVITLLLRFFRDWYYATGQELILKNTNAQSIQNHGPGDKAVQIISGGPDSLRPLIRDNYLYLIRHARKEILIQTPYFVPDRKIREALLQALESGISVCIMYPCKPDHPIVYRATSSYIEEMVKHGAVCYRYEKGFLHAKCMCVDKKVTCIGSANMDMRSFHLNCEVNALIFDSETAEACERIFRADSRQCTRMSEIMYRSRSVKAHLLEYVCRLFSPLL